MKHIRLFENFHQESFYKFTLGGVGVSTDDAVEIANGNGDEFDISDIIEKDADHLEYITSVNGINIFYDETDNTYHFSQMW